MKKTAYVICLLFIPLVLLALDGSRTNRTPVIPRKVLFGNPEKVMPCISPNRRLIAYLAPLDKNDEKAALNVWVKSLDNDDDRALTSYTDRSINRIFWSHDSSLILFLKDTDGDENWKLYGLQLHNKEITCYTPFNKVQTRIEDYKVYTNPSIILIGLNKDDPRNHDLYTLDLKANKLTLICKNPGGVHTWMVDRNLTIRAAMQDTKKGERRVIVKKGETWQPIRTYSFDESQHNCFSIGYSDKNDAVYMLEPKDFNTARLVAINCKTGAAKILAQHAGCDITGVYMHPDTDDIEAASYEDEKKGWIVLDQNSLCAKVLKAFEGQGNVHIESHDDKRTQWIVRIERDTFPSVYYIYDVKRKTITELFKTRPDVPQGALAPMEPIAYVSRDGLTIHGYITYPLRLPHKRLPLVLFVHGGPNARDSWGFDGRIQWLANRGYAVLQVNYRGSVGYGKAFITACNKEWGGKMHDDLIDGVNWAVKQGIADPKKIAIFGGSYGGYAALCGAAFTPDVFCCAVDCVGISNLITYMKSIPPYWEVWRAHINQQIGNPETEEEFLKSRSPLFKAHNIKIPLLIAHGAHDPRVNQAESEQIVATLKKHGIPHEYLLFPDEGHGFRNVHNRMKFYQVAEAFLARYLGGRCEA